MEVVLVELPHERSEVRMSEGLRPRVLRAKNKERKVSSVRRAGEPDEKESSQARRRREEGRDRRNSQDRGSESIHVLIPSTQPTDQHLSSGWLPRSEVTRSRKTKKTTKRTNLDDEAVSLRVPSHDLVVLRVLQHAEITHTHPISSLRLSPSAKTSRGGDSRVELQDEL